MMTKENKLKTLALHTAQDTLIYLTQEMKGGDANLKNQLKRSVTSVSANIFESEYAESRKDFIHKLRISLKEANESENWLILLCPKEKNPTEAQIARNLRSIKSMLIRSIRTAMDNEKK